jgi:hypothetical protein
LEHLIRLGVIIAQPPARQAHPGQVLQAMTQIQQVAAATAQLPGQLGGGSALGNAADDQHQGGGRSLRALEGSAGPGVEDAATGAAVVPDGVAVDAVDAVAAAATGRAAQATGVKGLDEKVLAGVVIKQVK